MFKLKFLILLLFSSLVFAQGNTEINKLFDASIKDYESSRWTSALSGFNKIAFEHGFNSKTTLALLFIGKINLELNNYADAEKNLIKLLRDYPQSKYGEEAELTLAKVYFENQNYNKAFTALCSLISNSKKVFTSDSLKFQAEQIALRSLSSEEVKAIYDTTQLTTLKPFLLLTNGKILIKEGYNEIAKENFERIVRLYPNSDEFREANRLHDGSVKLNENLEEHDIIGVILPLTSNSLPNTAASEILEGIKFALAEFNESRSSKIGILIRDTELNSSRIQEIHNEFINVKNLRCVIGPIYSSEVKEALQIFQDIDLPIISPTATDDYLTESSSNFFQANPSFIARGRLMAQYVYYVENKRKIAILNAVEGYSPALSSSFTQEFEKLGGQIIVRESYRSNTVDLKSQMDRIQEYLDQIDGLYIPLADKADIPVIISFLSQLDLLIPIYGAQDWMSTSGLKSATFLNNNLIFCSDYFLNFNADDYRVFNKDFYSRTNMDVNRNILYGYDTMKYILTIIRSSYAGSSVLASKMISGVISVGFHNNICFDSSRINRYMNIVRYYDGKFELIDKFKMSN